MKSASVVIGANFGDEGKGLLTDYLARARSADLVVRFNGGAQAGHTVVTPHGQRHVFHHFGSGTFARVPTFLSRFFIVNPLIFLDEHKELTPLFEFGLPPVFVDPRCLITTPVDMMINQALEVARGGGRHGSCGVGINETVVRSMDQHYRLTVGDAWKMTPEPLLSRLEAIKDYGIGRLEQLAKHHDLPSGTLEMVKRLPMIRFLDDLNRMFGRVVVDDPLKRSLYPVFEGAQGLLLDQSNKRFFPHVTRSNTGAANAAVLAEEVGIERLELHYVTRSYLTRHGAGELPNELPQGELPYAEVYDNTNVPNDFQGGLRYAYLDLKLLKDHVAADLQLTQGAHPDLTIWPWLAVTHLDQVDDRFTYYDLDGVVQHDRQIDALDAVLPIGITSSGPTWLNCHEDKASRYAYT